MYKYNFSLNNTLKLNVFDVENKGKLNRKSLFVLLLLCFLIFSILKFGLF